MNRNNLNLLKTMLLRDDQVSIINGILHISPNSGMQVPSTWLKDHSEILVTELATHAQFNIFQYTKYSTGIYGKHGSAGLTLQFINIATGEYAYAVYNVNLKRERTTKHGKKGEPLPKGRFSVGKQSTFYKFWYATGLPFPHRLSAFNDCIGKLKSLYFAGDTDRNNRMANKVMPLLTVSPTQMREILLLNRFNKYPTSFQQPTNNYPPTIPDKESSLSCINQDFQPIQTTCAKNYGTSKQGGAVTSNIVKLKKSPQDQTTEEWLADLENAENVF